MGKVIDLNKYEHYKGFSVGEVRKLNKYCKKIFNKSFKEFWNETIRNLHKYGDCLEFKEL